MECTKKTDSAMVLEKTLESPLDTKEIKPVNPKGNHRDKSLENLEFKRGKKKKDLVFTGLQTSQTNTSYHIQYQTQVGKKLSEPISHDSY